MYSQKNNFSSFSNNFVNSVVQVSPSGQIELYSHLPIMRQIVNALKSWDFNICSVFLLDTQFVLDCDKFLGGALTTLSTMVAMEVKFYVLQLNLYR